VLQTDSSNLGRFGSSIYARAKNLSTEEEIDNFEHKFPFTGKVRMDPASTNEQIVHMNVRRPNEFPGGAPAAKLVFDVGYKQ